MLKKATMALALVARPPGYLIAPATCLSRQAKTDLPRKEDKSMTRMHLTSIALVSLMILAAPTLLSAATDETQGKPLTEESLAPQILLADKAVERITHRTVPPETSLTHSESEGSSDDFTSSQEGKICGTTNALPGTLADKITEVRAACACLPDCGTICPTGCFCWCTVETACKCQMACL